MAKHIDTGLHGEALAEGYLTDMGWRIVERRWRDTAPKGLKTDVDIIAISDDGIYHFVEVKTRTRMDEMCCTGDFSPAAIVSPAKAKRMTAAAERYLISQNLNVEIFIDLIIISLNSTESHKSTFFYYTDVSR